MQELIKGVDLGEGVEDNQVEIEADGLDLTTLEEANISQEYD